MAQTPLSIHAPEGEPLGGLIVVQEAFGVNAHIEDVCGRFAAAGWLAAAPHLFHRTGDPQFGYDDFAPVMPHFQQLTAEGILDDIDAALAHFDTAGMPAAKVGIVGFCMGGTVALSAATVRPFGAAVTFYGGGVATGRFGFPSLIDAAPQLRAPWLGLFGDRDTGIPVEDVEQLRVAAASAPVVTEIVRYPEAGHGFHCDQRADYHAESARDAWARTIRWFSAHLAGIDG